MATSLIKPQAILAALAVTGAVAGGAGASVGTGVGASPIVLSKPALPGHRYALPSLYIMNTGTERTSYSARVMRVPPYPRGRVIPSRWVRFARRVVTLNGGGSVTVRLRLSVPAKAKPGVYASDVLVTSIVRGRGSTRVSTAAATALNFTVSRPNKHRRHR